MKTSIIFLLCMIISCMVAGQSEELDYSGEVLEESEVEVNAPKFTGIENYMAVNKAENFESIGDYLVKNIDFEEISTSPFIRGTEVIEFVVTPEGLLTGFNVINSVSYEIDEEMIRVLKTTQGMWRPGFSDNMPRAMKKEVSLAFTGYNSNKSFLKQAQHYFVKGSKKLLVEGKPKKALKKFDNAMLLMPYDQSNLLMRGICRHECGDIAGAKKDWNRLKKISGGEYHITHLTDKIKEREAYAELIQILEEE